jgi:hypothetical protein
MRAPLGSQPAWPGEPAPQDVVQILAGLSEQRDRLAEQRAATATASAEQLVTNLVAYASANPDADLEAELCVLLGDHLRRWRDLPVLEAPDSDALIDAVVTAAAASVREALAADGPTGWQSPWRALVAVAGVVPESSARAIDEAVDELRTLPDGGVLPTLPAGPTVAGGVRWARDAYGSRFALVAPIASAGRPPHWYLWDVDACAHTPMTVYAGFHDSPEQAFAEWQAAVGPVAAGAATLTDVDDPTLMVELFHRSYDYRHAPQSQIEEYVRSRRLTDEAIGSVQVHPGDTVDVLDAATAATGFIAWLGEHRPELAATDGLAGSVRELAASWFFGEPRALLGTCSPHRVAHAVLHLHNFYRDDFVGELMALMPDWTAWLAERNGTPAELAERCRPYALGATHPDVGADNSRPITNARVVE